MNADEKIPYGCYYIERDYLDYLREKDNECIPRADYEDEGRCRKFFCGPVFDEYGVNYFVPVSHEIDSKGTMTVYDKETKSTETYGLYLNDENGEKLGNLDFRFMVPCQDNELLTPYKPSGHGARQAEACKFSQNKICKEARLAYNNIMSGDYPDLTKGSVNFDKANDAMWDYEDEKWARRAQQAETMASNIRTTDYDSSRSL